MLTFPYRESALKGNIVFFARNVQNSAYKICSNDAPNLRIGHNSALLTLKVEKYLICLVGKRLPTVSIME
jgi:hypothetical protein